MPRNQPPAPLMNPIAAHSSRITAARSSSLDVQISMFVRSLDDDARSDADRRSDRRRLPRACPAPRSPCGCSKRCSAWRRSTARRSCSSICRTSARSQTGPSIYPYIRAVRAMIRDVADRRTGSRSSISPTGVSARRARSGRALVFPHDEHWTPAGHQLVADVAARRHRCSPGTATAKTYQRRIEQLSGRETVDPFNAVGVRRLAEACAACRVSGGEHGADDGDAVGAARAHLARRAPASTPPMANSGSACRRARRGQRVEAERRDRRRRFEGVS